MSADTRPYKTIDVLGQAVAEFTICTPPKGSSNGTATTPHAEREATP